MMSGILQPNFPELPSSQMDKRRSANVNMLSFVKILMQCKDNILSVTANLWPRCQINSFKCDIQPSVLTLKGSCT